MCPSSLYSTKQGTNTLITRKTQLANRTKSVTVNIARKTEPLPQGRYHDNKTPQFYSSTNVLLPSPITTNTETSTVQSTPTLCRTRHQPKLEQQTGTPETKQTMHARQPETSRTAGIKASERRGILGFPSTSYAKTASRQINLPAPYRKHMKSISRQPEQLPKNLSNISPAPPTKFDKTRIYIQLLTTITPVFT
jgi:hypothetical protein